MSDIMFWVDVIFWLIAVFIFAICIGGLFVDQSEDTNDEIE